MTTAEIDDIYRNGFYGDLTASVPLPGGLPLMLGGFAMLAAVKRRRARG